MAKLKEAMKAAKITKKRQKVTEGESDASFKTNISIRLDSQVLESLKKEADKLTIGYQTLINLVLAKHIEGQSYEQRLIAIEKKLKAMD